MQNEKNERHMLFSCSWRWWSTALASTSPLRLARRPGLMPFFFDDFVQHFFPAFQIAVLFMQANARVRAGRGQKR